MDPIKNNGAMDYTMTMPQQNNVQPTPEEDYSSMPMVYDPEVEEKKKASSNMLGMTALGLLAVGGMGYGNIIVLTFSTFFGKVFGKDRIPMTNVLGCVVKGISQIT